MRKFKSAFKHKEFLGIFVLISVIFLLMSNIITILFPQKDITINEISQTEYGIKDYRISDDGTLISTSFDPWVYLRYEELGIVRPVIVTVNIDSFENQDPGYLMYYVSSYLFQSGTKTTGDNIQPLVYKTFVDDGVRFDFTTLEGQSIKLNYFRINDNQTSTCISASKGSTFQIKGKNWN